MFLRNKKWNGTFSPDGLPAVALAPMPAVNIDSSPLPWMIASINQLVRLEQPSGNYFNFACYTQNASTILRGNDAICRKFHHLPNKCFPNCLFSFLPVCEHSVAILGIYIGIQEQFLPPSHSVSGTKENADDTDFYALSIAATINNILY